MPKKFIQRIESIIASYGQYESRSIIASKEAFATAVNKDLSELNAAISAYNKAPSEKSLWKVELRRKKIADKYPPQSVNECPDYVSKLNVTLYQSLNEQSKLFGLKSILDLSHQRAQKPEQPFATLLANLDNIKIGQLIKNTLNQKPPLADIAVDEQAGFSKWLPMSPRRGKAISTLMPAHTIDAVATNGNSSIYRVREKTGASSSFILKVEDLGLTTQQARNDIERYIPGLALSNLFERQATMAINDEDPTETITRTVVITEDCPRGSLANVAERQLSTPERLSSTLNYYSQAYQAFGQMAQHNMIFFDLKPENILVDTQGKVRLSDFKSVMYGDGSGLFVANNPLNTEGNEPGVTHFLEPPELDAYRKHKTPFSIDKAQSYMLGKDVYLHLIPPSEKDSARNLLIDQQEGSSFNFDAPIFKTERGLLLKEFITLSVTKDPLTRLSLEQASTVLSAIQHQYHNLSEVQSMMHQMVETNRTQHDVIQHVKTEPDDDVVPREEGETFYSEEHRPSLNADKDVIDAISKYKTSMSALRDLGKKAVQDQSPELDDEYKPNGP